MLLNIVIISQIFINFFVKYRIIWSEIKMEAPFQKRKEERKRRDHLNR